MSKELIKQIVYQFYQKATQDVFLGHHFRKIQTSQGDHPLKPPMEAFEDHLPRIEQFWRMQLLGPEKVENPFDLLNIHRKMKLNRGELDRWVLLFNQVLDEFQTQQPELISTWRSKIDLFKEKFVKDPRMFNHK
ncbi:hypothetical protein OAT67_01435 [Bacteriovoracaceae bacterium]|nr:hypothetical protein [Bacteriovoracaceae bacterium]